MHFLIFLSLLTCVSCSSSDERQEDSQILHQKGEYIYRKHDEVLFSIPPPVKNVPLGYPWEKELVVNHPKSPNSFGLIPQLFQGTRLS